MRISVATIVMTAFALFGSAAPVSRCAPILTHSAAALAHPPLASTTLTATNKLQYRPDVAAGVPNSSPFGRTTASVIRTDEPAADELTARAVSEDVDVLETVNNFVQEFEEAIKNPSGSSMASVERPLFSSGKWKAAAWAAHDPVLARAVENMQLKLPKLLNGKPDLDALARIGREKRLVPKYVRLQRLIANLSSRTRRNAARARAKLDAPPSASEGLSKSKRKLDSPGVDDLQAARASFKASAEDRTATPTRGSTEPGHVTHSSIANGSLGAPLGSSSPTQLVRPEATRQPDAESALEQGSLPPTLKRMRHFDLNELPELDR